MKILHFCLSCFYIDNYDYQENQLVRVNVEDGHDVLVVASTETYNDKKQLDYLEPSEYIGIDGAKVIRVPYRTSMPDNLVKKLRVYEGIKEILMDFSPDVILFHGMCAGELWRVTDYVKKHPNVKLYIDSHEDFHNSARSFISKWVLHYSFYKPILRRALKNVDKILAITPETISFVKDFYGVNEDKIELYPLGGEVLNDSEYIKIRQLNREKYHLSEDDIVLIQSGKMDRTKKLLETLRNFVKVPNQSIKLLIVGHIFEDISEEATRLIESDERISFLGWKSATELRDILCASDIYIQPATQTATMQTSLCCRCAVIIHDNPSQRYLVNHLNGWIINNKLSFKDALEEIASKNIQEIEVMSENSHQVAKTYLDYKKLAARLYI